MLPFEDRHDSLNLKKFFPSLDRGYPIIETCQVKPESITAYSCIKSTNTWIHFFIEDYRFESLWNNPDRHISKLSVFPGLFTPDFALYKDYPLPIQQFNVYRSRWIGAYWQKQGFNVIPSINWSDKSSFDFCFLGIPKNSTVAISTIGLLKSSECRYSFLEGYKKMLDILEPSSIILVGRVIEEMPSQDKLLIYHPSKERGHNLLLGGNNG